MKNTFWVYIRILTAAVLFLAACTGKHTKDAKTTSASMDLYTCSMHPQVVLHHAGNCPICGMKLIKKNTTPVALDTIDLETLLKPTNEFVVTSLPTTTPGPGSINIPVTAYGTIEADTRVAGAVSAKVSGRIEKLYLRYSFQKIEAGQKVAEIYSPELLTAQHNLLFLLKSDAQNTSFINAAKQTLLLLGMGSTELNKVMATGKPIHSVSIYSNYSGHVHNAGMGNDTNENKMTDTAPLTGELSLKEGMYVKKGQTLFLIMNHHKAWAALQIFPNQQSVLKKGDAVEIIPETDTSAVINGNIDFIEPFFRRNSKTLTARVYFQNMHMLTIGSQVKATIHTRNTEGLWLPQSAVITLGMNDAVFIKSDGGFRAHKVTTGLRTVDKVEILSGLSSADTVAANAQYLVDSESIIQTVSK